MALIARFEQRPLQPTRRHGEVVCGYAVADLPGGRVLQLETYGSHDRQMPEKVSQSIQIDEQRAGILLAILKAAFPDLA